MDWSFISESEDRTVPKFQETSGLECLDNNSSPPDAWLDWELTLSERFGTSNTCAKPAVHDSFDRQIQYTEYCYGSSVCPNNSNTYGGFSSVDYGAEKSLHLDERPDYQLQNLCQSSESLSSMQQMDNMFINSFIDEDPCDMGDSFQSLCSSTPFENLLTDMLADSPSIKKESSCMGGSKYLKPSDLPLIEDQMSGDWEDDLREEASLYDPASQLTPAYSGITDGSFKIKGSRLKVMIPNTVNTSVVAERTVGEESLEAIVLQELEVVMTKLNPKTRICFRDALYRLAGRSAKSILEASSIPTVHDDVSRCTSKKSTELETNAIDRAIANLMFNKFDSGASDFSYDSSSHKGALATIGSQEYCLKRHPVFPSQLPVSSCDEVEFPFSGRENKNSASLVYGYSRAGAVEVSEYVSEKRSHRERITAGIVGDGSDYFKT